MELVSILTRAESLFRRFERTVQAVDKKNNFPAPSNARQRIASPGGASSNKGKSPQRASSSGNRVSQRIEAANKEKVISPELRQLLSREVITLNSKEVRESVGNGNSKP